MIVVWEFSSTWDWEKESFFHSFNQLIMSSTRLFTEKSWICLDSPMEW